jgi:probable phosphoglycerate mutase
MTTFFLIRHGANDLLDRALAGRLPGVHLNAHGRQQAERLAERLAQEPIRRIYSSPLERSRETAQPLADRLGLEMHLVEELNEIDFGNWAGQTLAQLDAMPRWQQFNSFRGGTRAPNGELMLETQVRIVAFMQRIAEEVDDQAVALFSHGDVIRAALLFYLGAPIDLFQRLEVSPASVSAVRLGSHGPHILFINRLDS